MPDLELKVGFKLVNSCSHYSKTTGRSTTEKYVLAIRPPFCGRTARDRQQL